MPEVQIRPAVATDIPILMAIDHSCQTDYVWQMDVQHEEGQMGAIFREIRLPRLGVCSLSAGGVGSAGLMEPPGGYAGGNDWRTGGRIYPDE